MIIKKIGLCLACKKNKYIYAKKMCYSCYWNNNTNSALQSSYKPLSHKSGYKIPPISKKRSTELKTYSKLIKEIEDEAKASKNDVCFFCGEPIDGTSDNHHLDGREGEMLTKKEWIVRVHRECHSDYHDKPVWRLTWFPNYLQRLAILSPVLAQKETLKLDK